MAFWKDPLTKESDWFRHRMKAFYELSHPAQGGKSKPLDDDQAEEATNQANAMYGTQLFRQLLAGQWEVARHRERLRRAYRRLLFISTLTFFAGLVLLSVPVYQFFRRPEGLQVAHSVIGAVGGAQVVALLVFSPAERIRRLMRETTKATILLEAFQYTVNLQLIRYKGTEAHTIDAAVASISRVAYRSAQALQDGAGEDEALAAVASTLAAQGGEAGEGQRILDGLLGNPDHLRTLAEGLEKAKKDADKEVQRTAKDTKDKAEKPIAQTKKAAGKQLPKGRNGRFDYGENVVQKSRS